LIFWEAGMDPDLELVAGGRPLRFPAVWLRDNCPCPECLDPGTGQKLIDITGIPNRLARGLAGASPAGLLRRPGRLGQHAGRAQSL
jgi:hypothetical protein